jgi:hypothetical protein
LTAETHPKTAKNSQKAKIRPKKVGVKVLKPQQQPGNNVFRTPKRYLNILLTKKAQKSENKGPKSDRKG